MNFKACQMSTEATEKLSILFKINTMKNISYFCDTTEIYKEY
jgi:hypothetical protein